MKNRPKIVLPNDYALVLQQIVEDGEDDVDNLTERLNLHRTRVIRIISYFLNKGLIITDRDSDFDDTTIRLSRKGARVAKYLWPEYYAFL